jgi:sigma-E factor negative regulatory protein RseC
VIETRARIVSVAGGTAWVDSSEHSGCGACHAKGSCGISGLGRFLSNRRQPVPVSCPSGARPGEELVVAVAESELLKAGLLAYVLPVVLAVAGAGLAALRNGGDLGAVLGMLIGVAAGLAVARFLGRTPRLTARPSTHTRIDSTPQGEQP